MERRISVKPLARLLLLVIIAASTFPLVRADSALVLVTSSDSPITEISALEIRKAYLGIRVEIDGQPLRPVRLNGDTHLNEVFMQSVIAMSERSYERRLLSLTLKFGQPRPEQASNPAELAEMLDEKPNTIGYMWQDDADSDSRVKIVRVLWQER